MTKNQQPPLDNHELRIVKISTVPTVKTNGEQEALEVQILVEDVFPMREEE